MPICRGHDGKGTGVIMSIMRFVATGLIVLVIGGAGGHAATLADTIDAEWSA